jgi:hypothetical protein
MGEGPKRKDSRGMLANGSGRVRFAIGVILDNSWGWISRLFGISVEADEDDIVFDGSLTLDIYH